MADAALPASLPMHLRGLKELPIVRQLLLLVGLAGAIAGGLAIYNWSQRPGQVELYPELAGQDASAAAESLRAAGIEYELDSLTGRLTVSGAKVHEARLLLASQGLPKSGASGFEMMQQDQGMGVSSFLEGARYNHALETELSRSIGRLSPVKNARVHLAIPKPSAFARPGDGASASVLVELHPGRALEANQVQAIVHMIASSVPNLAPARVTVVDQFGRLVSGKDNDELAVSAEQFDHARRVEADYVRRVEALLLPVAGPGKVSTQVSAELDFSVTEEARETYAPDKTVVRSEQTSAQTTTGPGGNAQGVPGATSNQPPQTQPALPVNQLLGQPTADAAAPVNSSTSSTRNYEVDRTLSHTRQPVGRLKKLSIAVLVDNLPRPDGKGGSTLQPLGAEDLKKIETLVRDAVGFDEARGDRVTVQNVSFLPAATADAPADIPMWQQPQAQALIRHGFGLLAILVLIFAALRPALKVLLAPPSPKAAVPVVGGVLVHDEETGGVRVRGRAAASAGTQDEEIAIFDGSGPYEKKLEAARAAVGQDPKRVAQVVKSWLAEEGAA
ncbi:MAG: fliF [Panacagrimonas sp.]|jgi:flagellar M-ring protein FliF|nr:flagellar basal-body MS-ring/collar protein FliF [Panacagrimonas sp.]MCC2657283.1 fliF [Panacagrimonas sp.]